MHQPERGCTESEEIRIDRSSLGNRRVLDVDSQDICSRRALPTEGSRRLVGTVEEWDIFSEIVGNRTDGESDEEDIGLDGRWSEALVGRRERE